jgi:tryptophan synthase alpha subunit
MAAARKVDITAKERTNARTVGLAGGLIEDAPLRLAAKIARVVNEEDKLHVIPIVTRGATENVTSLLYLLSQGR